MLNLSFVFQDTHKHLLAHRCGKIFSLSHSSKIFMFVELSLFFLNKFVLVSTLLLYLHNQHIRLRLLDLLLSHWSCHCDKQWEYLAPFFALQPKLKKISFRQEVEVLFQLVPVFIWELSCPNFPFFFGFGLFCWFLVLRGFFPPPNHLLLCLLFFLISLTIFKKCSYDTSRTCMDSAFFCQNITQPVYQIIRQIRWHSFLLGSHKGWY